MILPIHVILEHVVDLGIKGQLLELIRSYLSERYAKVYYKGYLTPNAKKFELGTPQGGVLSPFLFNILMDKLMKMIALPSPNCKIICYADDICIHAADATEMQNILDQISNKVKELGLIISVPKTKYHVSSVENIQLMLNDNSINRCNEYKYLGVPTPLPNNYVKVLCDRLSRRLRPLKTLANRIAGVNIKLCLTFYIAYVRSLVDYNSLQLASLSRSSLRPLETIQNRAMRIILGCPSSTRIILMQKELNLPPIIDFIQQVATIAGVKVATTGNVNHVYEDGSCMLKNMLTGDLAYDKTLHPKIFSIIVNNVRRQNVKLSVEVEVSTPINPVEIIAAEVNIPLLPYDSQNNASIMKACWSESLHTVLIRDFKNLSPLLIYTDGSLNSSYGQAGSGMVVYDNSGRNKIHVKSMVRPKWSTVYESELFALLVAVTYAADNRRDALIISDSKSALQSLNKEKTLHKILVNKIQKQLAYCRQNGKKVMFMWVPAHVGIAGNETADKLAKAGSKKTGAPPEKINLKQLRRILQKETAEARELAMIGEWCDSSSIKHYERFSNIKHYYGKANILAGPCDRIAARIRLGYRKVWELNQEKTGRANPEYSNCVLCKKVHANTLMHYICFCSKLDPFRPKEKTFHELCLHFCKPENIIPVLTAFPGFCM